MNNIEFLKSKIRNVPDYPKLGINFKDITTLLKDPKAFAIAIEEMKKFCEGRKFDFIVGAESRGFIFGSVLAKELGVGFIPVRKAGKLPAEKIRYEYKTEYSIDAVEMHKDSISAGQKVLIVDDLLATGGTALAMAQLVEKLGGVVEGFVFLIELGFLNGKEKLEGYDVQSVLKY